MKITVYREWAPIADEKCYITAYPEGLVRIKGIDLDWYEPADVRAIARALNQAADYAEKEN